MMMLRIGIMIMMTMMVMMMNFSSSEFFWKGYRQKGLKSSQKNGRGRRTIATPTLTTTTAKTS